MVSMRRSAPTQVFVSGALAIVLSACGGIPHAPEGAITLTEPAAELSGGRDALVAEADRATALGPAGPDLERALDALQRVLWAAPEDDEASWKALRAFHYLSVGRDEDETNTVGRRCQPLASRVAAGDPGPRAAMYAAACLGQYARATENMDLVKEVVRLLVLARKADPQVEAFGPDRILGAIYLRAPAWPVSVGDIDKGLGHLKAAARGAPAWPENHLLLAEAYASDERADKAKAALARAEEAMKDPRFDPWRAAWQADAARVRESL